MRIKARSMTSVIAISLCAAISSQAAPPVDASTTTKKNAPTAAAPLSAPPAKVPAATKEAKPDAPVSVLERFRTYSGQRTPAALSELFIAPVWAGVRQQPEIALSNGAVAVGIAAAIPVKDNIAPNFAFNAASLLSSAQLKKDEWLIVSLPETGALKAEMIVLSGGVIYNIPLTVAPPLPAETDLSEKGFIAFLGSKAADAKSLQDLNNDGRRDYVDDYIFTANYLVNKISPLAARKNDTSADPLTAQTPSQPAPSIEQQIRDLQDAGTARSNEQQTSGEGQGSVPSFGSGWGTGGGTIATSPTTTTGGTTVTGGATSGTTGGVTVTEVTPDSSTGDKTDGTKTGVYTITTPTGKSLTYIGTPTPSSLNMRNLKAKELKDKLNTNK